jgi:hypothetical protein
MKIQHLAIGAIHPYSRNPRRNDAAVARVARSIEEFGFNQPIVVDPDMTIVVGHTRYKAAQRLGLHEVPVLVIEDISPEKLQAYRIADNRLNELAEWDDDLLLEEIDQIIERLGSAELTGFTAEDLRDRSGIADHSAYSRKIDTPMYQPRGTQPQVDQLYDQTRTHQLIQAIDQANLAPEIRDFLTAAARRHTVFDYHNIAEYYCHAGPELQQLMEQSALVIIDFNQAIESGYVRLTEDLKHIYAETIGDQDDPG